MPRPCPRRSPLLLALVAALALAGCGVKGPLEPPPGATPTAEAGVKSGDAPKAAPEKPNPPFVLDGLL
ncbi:MAG TPA: lipoprotein [Xanthobacteraceae bacterium]|nr:lipoprotein [Xanthobacteraceae bacterium]